MVIHDRRRVVSIIDDDPSLRRALRNLLRSAGFQVETFESAEAFLESDHRESARCLVLDLQLPKMSGLELLTHLTAAGTRNRIVVLTAHGDNEIRRRFLEAGAVAFIEKPFESAALLEAVHRAASSAESEP